MTGNTRITAFTATTVANQVVGPNPLRRGLRIQIFGPPDVTGGITVWMDDSGNHAVVQACWQIISGAVWEWGRPDTREFSRAQHLSNCPTAAISVITSTGSATGLIEELE
jgi:hypothetical protein